MDKLGLLFDPKEFAVAFGAATGDLRSAATEARPDATVWLEGGAAVAGAGFAWGHGQIHYKRNHHGFSISGLSIADVHAASISATGMVMRLRQLSDFSGDYSGLGAEATATGDGSATYLKNERGVVIKLVAADAGLRFKVSVKGVRVKLDPTASRPWRGTR
jgi:hypothetical protein